MTTRYLVLDIETVPQADLVSRVRYAGEKLVPEEALKRYRAELMAENGKDFAPWTYHVPVAAVVGKVTADYRLEDLISLDEPEFRPHLIADRFWKGMEGVYRDATLVTFNGRTFDLPVMEMAAFRYGIAAPGWFSSQGPSYKHPRNRYNQAAHLDLMDVVTNHSATRGFAGGLSLLANLIGKPGKMDVQGSMVLDMHQAGKRQEISDYCRCDVLDTYFVFLRTLVMTGELGLEKEQERVAETKKWLEERRGSCAAYALYLDRWGDWVDPRKG